MFSRCLRARTASAPRNRDRHLPKPNFFILGAPKCGTTSLASWLAEHPSIFVSPIKEPKYFSTDIPHQKYITTRTQYNALFDAAGEDHLAVGEASTEYLYSTDAVPRIVEFAPDARMVVCLRNPVTLAPSLHEQMVFDGDEPILDFWQAWQAQFPTRQAETILSGPYAPKFYAYGPRCRLGEQVERVLTQVPRDRVHFIFAEDLRNNSAATYCALLDFLGVKQDGRTQFPSLNPAKTLRLPRIKHWLNRANAAKHRLGLNVNTGLATRLTAWNRQDRPRRSLDAAQRIALEDYFREDIARLQAVLGVDLDHWLSQPGGGCLPRDSIVSGDAGPQSDTMGAR
jgi:hypothetical protein